MFLWKKRNKKSPLSIREKNKFCYEEVKFMKPTSSFKIGNLKIKLGETHLHLSYGNKGLSANIAYSHIRKVAKFIIEKLQDTKSIV